MPWKTTSNTQQHFPLRLLWRCSDFSVFPPLVSIKIYVAIIHETEIIKKIAFSLKIARRNRKMNEISLNSLFFIFVIFKSMTQWKRKRKKLFKYSYFLGQWRRIAQHELSLFGASPALQWPANTSVRLWFLSLHVWISQALFSFS